MHGARKLECTMRTECDREGVESLTAVELLILCTIHRVERRNPECNCDEEHDRRQLNFAADRHPTARRCHADGDAEEEMHPPRHTLHIRIDEEGHSRKRQKSDADGIQLQNRKYKHKEAHAYKDERLLLCHAPLHHRTISETGLLFVIFQIGEIVESECRRARRRDGEHDPAKVAERRIPSRREQGSHQGERQGEHRMMKGGIVHVRPQALHPPAQSRPNSFHRASTRFTISSDISISSGHSRA